MFDANEKGHAAEEMVVRNVGCDNNTGD